MDLLMAIKTNHFDIGRGHFKFGGGINRGDMMALQIRPNPLASQTDRPMFPQMIGPDLGGQFVPSPMARFAH